MFTGIVHSLGVASSVTHHAKGLDVVIACDTTALACQLGSSIAVNGVCSTVVSYDETSFSVQYLPETLQKTGLSTLTKGDRLNLEPSVRAGDPLSGHYVSGHIDATGTITAIEKAHPWGVLSVRFSVELAHYFVYKGSVCLEGISLTIAALEDTLLTCHIIPHTYEQTVLQDKCVGDTINIECDLLGKYVVRCIEIGSVSVK